MSEVANISTNKVGIEPKKLFVWLFSISISMIFAALTSAYIVRRAEGNWLEFDLPSELMWSTVAIVISSLFMFFAQKNIKENNIKNVRICLIVVTLLGVLFSYLQYLSWTQLHLDGIYFTGPTSNPSGSFIYVIIWTHLFHIVTGLIYLFIVLGKSFLTMKRSDSLNEELFSEDEFVPVLNSENSTVLESCAIYWHFLGLLWIYLYMFLYFYH